MPNISGRAAERNSAFAAAPINPAGIYCYIDRLKLWLPRPLDRRAIVWLRQRCGSLHVYNHPARFDRRLLQRLDIKQPNPEALRFLSSIPLFLNYVELALDWTFDYQSDLDHAWDFVNRHSFKKYLRGEVRFSHGTRYTNPRTSASNLVHYADKPSKLNGQQLCLHADWRLQRRKAVEQAGIHSVGDLLQLNPREFWQQRLQLCSFDLPKLGRMIDIHVHGKGTRRTAWITWHGRFAYDHDRAIGMLAPRAFGSVQNVLAAYRQHFPVNKCLLKIDVSQLLPQPV